MAAKRERRCPYCFAGGITAMFTTGNDLKKHVKTRHPQTPAQKTEDRRKLNKFRRQLLLDQQKSRL